MALHPLKSAAALLLTAGTIAAGLGARAGQEPAEKPARPTATSSAPGPDSPIDGRLMVMEKRFEAMSEETRFLRLRVNELERRLEAIEGLKTATRPVGLDPDSITRIRPRFNDVLIQRVFVKVGQSVKKGDPLLELRSADLAAARNECRTRFVQWDHDHKYLIAREPLAKENRITQIIWTDTLNDEKKSRLDYLVARERLMTYGMSVEEIDGLLEGLSDDRKKAPGANDISDITRMTVVSPIDGVVLERNVALGNFYDTKDVLLVLAPPTTVAPQRH
jgi:cobalt-zinc-cadmium efflux system membrane fusion protein